jgi:predicted acetyltransferase
MEYLDDLVALAREHAAAEEPRERTRYDEALRDAAAYVRRLQDSARGVNLAPGRVPQTTYWLVRGGKTIVAASNLRHALTDHLEHEGGHIGYATRPSQRRKGYGTRLCALTLEKARAMGMKRILITCDEDNIASARIIEKNGGKLENKVVSRETGKVKNRYWIDL